MRKIIAAVLALTLITLCGCNDSVTAGGISALTTKTHNVTIAVETPPPVSETVAGTTSAKTETTTEKIEYGGHLTAHFIDVGQGDSIFIELPDGESMLIDAGESGKGPVIVDYIKSLGYDKIDFLIATHPHSDHIGGMADILKEFQIGCLYLSPATHTTATFENFLDTIAIKGVNTKVVGKGDIILDGEHLKAEILSPGDKEYSGVNNYSVVLRITFGEVSFLFMGDAEREAENDITLSECDVVKIGHHGSSTSTSEEFLKKTKPRIAVISCGENNTYGHPADEVITRLKSNRIVTYRTDLHGTIILTSDGHNVEKL